MDRSNGWWQPRALLPAFIIIGPYFLNKLIYIADPGYDVFIATDYACRTWSLVWLFLLLRGTATGPAGKPAIQLPNELPIALPIPWRFQMPTRSQVLIIIIGTLASIAFDVSTTKLINALNSHSGRLTSYPDATNTLLQYFDGTVGMIFVGLSEEVIFRFYLMNLLLLRGGSHATTIILSSLIFGSIHWSYGFGSVVFASVFGVLASFLLLKTRNLVVPVAVHATYDAFFFAGGIAFLGKLLSSHP
jgi:membrane protease YdiL (CAAX protease family)